MPWTPEYTTINSRAIAENLLTYFETNQADALAWAGGGSLKLIRRFSDTVINRSAPIYPSILILTDNDTQPVPEGDVVTAAYSVTFQVHIASTSLTTAMDNAVTYRNAIMSIFRNCPESSLLADTGANTIRLAELGTEMLEVYAADRQNDFLQRFNIGASYILTDGVYS